MTYNVSSGTLNPTTPYHTKWTNNNNNNNPIYKTPKALASEVLAAGHSWVLLKCFTENYSAIESVDQDGGIIC